MKRLWKSAPVRRFLIRLFADYLWFALRTTRWTLDGAENFAPHGAGAPAIFGFWHETLPMMPALALLARRAPGYNAAPIHTLVSQHRDGRSIGEIVRRFGIEPVFGSTSRGGGAGLLQLVRLVRSGAMIGITPDGPRGPRRTAAAGIAHLAALAGTPVLPCGASMSHRIILGTWDRMTLPLPFGRGVVVCGPAIPVSRDGSGEALPAIAAAITAATNRADDRIRGGRACPV